MARSTYDEASNIDQTTIRACVVLLGLDALDEVEARAVAEREVDDGDVGIVGFDQTPDASLRSPASPQTFMSSRREMKVARPKRIVG